MGPFDPALHIKSRDHYEPVRREAQLIVLASDSPPVRFQELLARIDRQFPRSPVDEVADRAYLAREPAFVVRFELPDELVPAALAACDELEALLEELDRWSRAAAVELLEAPEEVKRYRRSFLAQARAQLQAARGDPAVR